MNIAILIYLLAEVRMPRLKRVRKSRQIAGKYINAAGDVNIQHCETFLTGS